MNGDDDDSGDWIEWRRLILHEIKRLNEIETSSSQSIAMMQKDIGRLNLWATICGGLGGIIATMLVQAAFGT